MYSHSLKEHCNTLVNVLEMEMISLTKMSYNYIDQGSREVNNDRAAEAEMFKTGARSDPTGTRSWNLPGDQSTARTTRMTEFWGHNTRFVLSLIGRMSLEFLYNGELRWPNEER